MDAVIEQVLAAVERHDQVALKALLHPYLHWNEPRLALRGRVKVLARLAASPAPGPPDSYELRDGQIYRWTSTGVPDAG
ncbi:nuclear transport factor 2 family protein [Actinoplanes sp. NPDC049548]|uniref:nuclear transport factor 2 family protein n=1 Tax=Actinoplanes sp. NPDC049548 TaxID=3155152 RepID=UPI00342D6C55